MKLSFKLLMVGGVFLLGVAAVYGALFYRPPANLHIGQAMFLAKIAASEAQRERGLSGTGPLGDRDAMLFVFPTDGVWGFWMKDMNYPIDIVWLDSNKVVQYIVNDVQPNSYPRIFQPQQPARYVVEMKSGTAKHKSITIGTRAEFALP